MAICARILFSGLLFSVLTTCLAPCQAGRPPVVLKDGQTFDDHRLAPLKDLNGYFPFSVPESKEAWKSRAEKLRRRILVANGLWPMPEKTPLNAVVHGKIERDGFTVEKVYFESRPGFYVTGQLFRPTKGQGPFPGVLCPHGHGGRLQDAGPKKILTQIVNGQERFESSGRFPKLARCAQLARMGCVTFIYDMIGYADNTQLSYQLAHRFAKQRPEMSGPTNWGLYSAQAEMRHQTIMGLQTWNSIRALDFLCSLEDVDKSRLGVTGGSGGGTQTILLCAIDERPVVAFPQGMVSTAMQGGCTCENVSLLRIGTGNVELAALFAPRPMAMTAANDWTKDMMTLGYPELRKLYAMLGYPNHVDCEAFLHFPHNYNYVTRARMYSWFNKHLKLGLQEPIVEQDFPILSPDELTVWDKQHPAPANRGDEFERQLLAQITQESEKQLHSLIAPEKREKFQELIGKAIQSIIGRTIDNVGKVKRDEVSKVDRGDYLLFTNLLSVQDHKEQVPVVSIHPQGTAWNNQVILWITSEGSGALFDESGQIRDDVHELVKQGYSILTADLFAQGEWESDELPSDRNRTVSNPREYAGYTYTYNDPLFIQRVHDILSIIRWARTGKYDIERLLLVGTDGAGPLALAAGVVAGDSVTDLAVETNGFRFRDITDYRDANFVPGILKYGGIPTLAALNASKRMLIIDNKPVLDLVSPLLTQQERKQASQIPSKKGTTDLLKWIKASQKSSP